MIIIMLEAMEKQLRIKKQIILTMVKMEKLINLVKKL